MVDPGICTCLCIVSNHIVQYSVLYRIQTSHISKWWSHSKHFIVQTFETQNLHTGHISDALEMLLRF